MANNNGKKNGSSNGDVGNASYEAKDIYVLEGLDPVRKRPGMYIGSTGIDGVHHLVWEVVDNSQDEAMAGHATAIEVAFLPQNRVRVKDNGRGIPVATHKQTKKSALETVMCTLHAGGKFGGDSYKISGGLHGVGVSVVNALSIWMRAEVCRDGYLYIQEYSRGKPKYNVKKAGKCDSRGTTMYFEPDDEIFKDIRFNLDTIISHLRQQAYLVKGTKITIRDLRQVDKKAEEFFAVCDVPSKKKIIRERKGPDTGERSYGFFIEGGIVSYVKFLNNDNEARHNNIFYANREQEGIQVEVAFQYTDDLQGYEMSFANNIYTVEGGMHLTGFRTALTRGLNDYARKNNFLKSSDENLTGDDVREGITAVISVKLREPQFEGQTKAKLGNPEARTVVDAVVADVLEEYLEKNPNDAKEILGQCVLAAKARQAAKAAKDTVLRKGILDGLSLPGKLADCSSRQPEESELFIVEGDSAGGCWDGDTKIALADGREISFKRLVEENQQGKENFCYTIYDNGHIGIAPILNPRITKLAAKVIKIILDNNEELICTPDHKFRLIDGSYIPAAKLTINHSIAPLYRKISKKEGKYTLDGYEMIFDSKAKKWNYTHVLSDMYNLRNGVYTASAGKHRHHINFDKRNNNPTNIRRFSYDQHMNLHYERLEHTLHRPDVIEKSKKAKQTVEFRERARTKSLEKRELFSQNAKKQWQDENYKSYMSQKFLEFYNNNADYRKKNNKLLDEVQKKYWSDIKNKEMQAQRVRESFIKNPDRKIWLSELAKRQWEDEGLKEWRRAETKEQWTPEFRQKRKEAYDRTYLRKAMELLYGIYIKEKLVNKSTYNQIRKVKNDKSIIRYETICNRFFSGDEDRLKEAVMHFNHRVKAVISLKDRIDVYDLEVLETHNFALAAGIFVHNSAKQGRDRKFQAILPLRGKILNVEKARLDKALSSKEVKALIIALGTAIADSFDISKLRYHKIVIMTDADVDGAHIRTLLLTLFFRYFQPLIEAGNIYIAQPPLFRVAKGKDIRYAYDEAERDKLIAEFKKMKADKAATKIGKLAKEQVREEEGEAMEDEERISGVSVQRYKGLGEMNPSQLWETTMDPAKRVLKQVKIADAKEADKVFDILMGDEVAPRKRFIQTHAKNVVNLDI